MCLKKSYPNLYNYIIEHQRKSISDITEEIKS